MPSDQPSPEPIQKLGDWNRPASMPDSLAAEVAGWRFVLRNPAAASFYSKPGAPWTTPSDGCLRVSDRWNLPVEGGAPAFATDQAVADGHWASARFDGTVWRVEGAAPANGRAAAKELLTARAERLTAARRWTRNDLDLLQRVLDGGVTTESALAGEETLARSLKSLKTLALVWDAAEDTPETPDAVRTALAEGAGPVLWMDDDARAVATEILEWHARKQARATARSNRHAQARDDGDALKRTIADAVLRTFPGMPKDAAATVAARLAPSVAKLAGRLPGFQAIVDATAEVRLERWRQAVASEPEVADRLLAMQMRGDAGRKRKRYRDQRAVERVETELKEWRGSLGPVTTHRLGHRPE